MGSFEIQNVLMRSFEVQNLTQQAIYHNQLAQDAQALTMRQDQVRRHTQVAQLAESQAGPKASNLGPDDQPGGRPPRQPLQRPGRPAPAAEKPAPLPQGLGGHIDTIA